MKILKIFFKVLAVLAVGCLLLILNSPKAKKIEYGVTFSQMQAQEILGLDWKKVYEEMLVDLNVKLVRIPVYWNKVQPGPDIYKFEDLDYQIKLAEKHNAKIVLSVGRKVPRWPECFEPDWLKELSSQNARENALLSFVETVILRYSSSPAIAVWQVENEPFLGSFGICPKPEKKLLDSEIALVRKLDPTRPILISDSGELSSWIPASRRGEIFGTTLYRFVFSDVFNRYWVNYIPFWFYRVKAGYVRIITPNKPIQLIELQAEPWTTQGLTNTSLEEQFKTMSLQKFETMLSVGKKTGFSPQYLWGVEWWYWMKEKQNHPEFWAKAKELFN